MIREYRPEDALLIVNDMRPEQVAECVALGSTPIEAIRLGLEKGSVKTLELSGEVAGLVGLIQGDDHVMPWSVFNSAICRHPKEFLRECKRWVDSVDAPMCNAVDARDTKAIRWLQWLGFTVCEPEPLGINGELMRWYFK